MTKRKDMVKEKPPSLTVIRMKDSMILERDTDRALIGTLLSI